MSYKQNIPFLLIVSQAFGAIGGWLQIPRLLALLFLPILIFNYRKEMKSYSILYIFFFSYLLYQLVFMMVDSVNSVEILKYFFYSSVNFLIFIEIVNFSLQESAIRMYRSWFVFVLVTIPIALYELVYDVHFYTSKLEANFTVGGSDKLLKYAGITYGNYNLYNYLLAIALPFCIAYYKSLDKFKFKKVYFLFFVLLTAIVFINNSRGALICFLICFLCSLYFMFKNVSFAKVMLYAILISLPISMFLLSGYWEFNFFNNRIFIKGLEDQSRLEMILAGLDMFSDSSAFGYGPGSFSRVIGNYSNSAIKAPHNIFIEFLTEFGFFIFALFILLLSKIFFTSYLYLKKDLILKFVIVSSIFIYPISHTINSVYLDSQYTWILLATIFSLTHNFKNSLND